MSNHDHKAIRICPPLILLKKIPMGKSLVSFKTLGFSSYHENHFKRSSSRRRRIILASEIVMSAGKILFSSETGVPSSTRAVPLGLLLYV